MTSQRKSISGHGKGKWQTDRSLAAYRRKRDARNRTQKASRARNRK